MAARIRMKKLGRKHRPFFRICVMDGRTPRDGRVIEEVGYYDPMVRDTDARAILKQERIDYWLSVGAQPTDKVGVLIKKYGSSGTHAELQRAALEKLAAERRPAPVAMQAAPESAAPEQPAAEAAPEPVAEEPAGEAPATE